MTTPAEAKLAEFRAWLLDHQARWAATRGGGGHGYRDGTLDFIGLALTKLDAPLGRVADLEPPAAPLVRRAVQTHPTDLRLPAPP